MFSAGVGVGTPTPVSVGSKKVGSRSRFFELKQFLGWSRNPEKSSDSTTLVFIPSILILSTTGLGSKLQRNLRNMSSC